MHYLMTALLFLLVSNFVSCISSDKCIIPARRESTNTDEWGNRGLRPARLMLFVAIPSNVEWGNVNFDVPINYKEHYSKINYSIYYSISDIDKSDTLNDFTEQLKTRVATDPILHSKLKDKYFCLGLIKSAQKKLPQYGHLTIAFSLASHTLETAMPQLSNEFWDGAIDYGIFVSKGQVQLYEEEFGFYALEINGKKSIIDMDWTFCSDYSKGTWLGLMVEKGYPEAVACLLKTKKFDISKHNCSERELLGRANRNKLANILRDKFFIKLFFDGMLKNNRKKRLVEESIATLATIICNRVPNYFYDKAAENDWDELANKICNKSLEMIKRRCSNDHTPIIEWFVFYQKKRDPISWFLSLLK